MTARDTVVRADTAGLSIDGQRLDFARPHKLTGTDAPQTGQPAGTWHPQVNWEHRHVRASGTKWARIDPGGAGTERSGR